MDRQKGKQNVWWKEGVLYQVYPRSFMDSTGNGIGDIQGIINKLHHIANLGVDIVWLNPVYASPNDDNGYDISSYFDIMDEFGTMADWEQLLHELHKRDMRLVMDLVVNHTSDEHTWFVESRKSTENYYRNYYFWRPPKAGAEPNNWASIFGGSAWAYDDTTGEYYLHIFSKKQPDLNWENPNVRMDIYKMIRWWLDKGIDGFRLDAINLISKTPGLPDIKPVDPGKNWQPAAKLTQNGPRGHTFLKEMREKTFGRYDAVSIGECANTTPEEALKYIEKGRGELDMLIPFEHFEIFHGPEIDRFRFDTFNLVTLKRIMEKWQQSLHGRGWMSLYWENHDFPRSVSRYGNDDTYRYETATMLATALFTMEGTPFIYQGQEIGMTNAGFTSIEKYRDVETLNYYNEEIESGKDKNKVMEQIARCSRDNARTPMQWDASENAGFTTGTPWIDVNPHYRSINVKQDTESDTSIQAYYRRLISLRKENPTLIYGYFKLILAEHSQLFAYTRSMDKNTILILLHFNGKKQNFPELAEYDLEKKECIVSNYTSALFSGSEIVLRPYEARVYRISK